MGYVGAGFVVNQANTTDGGAINTVAYASTGASAGQYVGGAYAVNLYTGPYGTLSLDFINNYYAIVGVSKTFSQAITFSRASNATRFAPNGVLQYAPHNLLLQSQNFATSWTVAGTNATVTSNTTAAPDGTTTADTLTDNATSGVHRVAQSLTTSNTNQMVYSVFAKYSTLQWISISLSTSTGTWAGAKFDVQNGVLGSTSQQGAGFTANSSSITAVGNGWYRCVLVLTPGASGSTVVVISGATDGTTFTTSQRGSEVYSGTSSSVFLWGAQLAVGPYPLDYTPTTTAVVYGPRFDYNPVTLAPLGLLIEEQRTNLVLQSQTFDNASWAAIRTTVTANSTTAPDGTSTADTLTGNGVSGAHVIQNGLGISFLAATYTLSVFAKADTNNFIQLRFFSGLGGAFANFNLATGAVGTSGAGATASIQNVGSGWYRCIMTATTTASASGGFNFWLVTSDSAVSGETNSLSTSVFLWGAQLEAGSFATSYIPTLVSTVTRSADVASINTLSPWYNQAEGSFFAEWRLGQDTSSIIIYQVDDGTNTNVIRLRYGAAGTSNDTAVIVGNVVQATLAVSTQQTPNTTYKNAMAYKLNDFARSADGGVAITNNSGTLPTVTQLGIGRSTVNTEQPNGHIRRISYYNRRLTNAELQALSA